MLVGCMIWTIGSRHPMINSGSYSLEQLIRPADDVSISDRRTRDVQGDKNGAFLRGVTKDLANMEDAVGGKLYNTLKNLYMTKAEAVGHIKGFFKHCMKGKFKPMLYYTGHGEVGTGNWCFKNGTISIEEIVDIMPTKWYNSMPREFFYPLILSDACYSGNWANWCCEKDIDGFSCVSACPEFSTALDVPGKYRNGVFSHLIPRQNGFSPPRASCPQGP